MNSKLSVLTSKLLAHCRSLSFVFMQHVLEKYQDYKEIIQKPANTQSTVQVYSCNTEIYKNDNPVLGLF